MFDLVLIVFLHSQTAVLSGFIARINWLPPSRHHHPLRKASIALNHRCQTMLFRPSPSPSKRGEERRGGKKSINQKCSRSFHIMRFIESIITFYTGWRSAGSRMTKPLWRVEPGRLQWCGGYESRLANVTQNFQKPINILWKFYFFQATRMIFNLSIFYYVFISFDVNDFFQFWFQKIN